MLAPPPSTPRMRGSERIQDSDAAIRQTDTDAALARLSAVSKGYLNDPFIAYLVRGASLQPPRPPLINVGTHARSYSIDRLTMDWMELSRREYKQCQIVSLGAGSDTRFWRIATGPYKDQLKMYIEVDLPEVTTKKAMSIQRTKAMRDVLGPSCAIGLGGQALHSTKYHLLPCDLREPPAKTLPPLLGQTLSPTLPTLLLFECVLVYMPSDVSSALIQWFVDCFQSNSDSSNPTILGALVYEMFGLQDNFGQVMINNLRSRNVALPGAQLYPTLQSLPQRFTRHGFTTARALTLRDIREKYISPSELSRISSLEMLDEIEELELVLKHYAITWGIKVCGSLEALNSPWSQWGYEWIARPPSPGQIK